MEHFYITDGAKLIRLLGFAITPGTATVIRVPTINGSVIQQGRRNPDTFLLRVSQLLPTAGGFRVIDENGIVYNCVGSNVNVLNGVLSIGGVIAASWEAEQREAAIAAVKAAKDEQQGAFNGT